MVKIEFYVPKTHLEIVKNAMFAKGAGVFQGYRQCAWQTEGLGQFVADTDSQPFVGQLEALTFVKEFKVEMVCAEDVLNEVIATMIEVHPYEVPAYFVYQGVH